MSGGVQVDVARRIGEDVAGKWADEVDRDARFPAETAAEMRAAGLLSALLPAAWGGPGAGLGEMAGAVSAISEFCASSGLVLAMHSIQVACLVRHGSVAALEALAPRLVAGELLLANANSEIGLGGERRSSLCALEPVDGGFRLDKQASTVSYGEYADGIFATARRAPESPPQEQVMAVCLPPEMTLEPSGEWDTLGLRGTCSRPGHLVATVPPELVIEDYPSVFVRTALPVSTVLLGSVWRGLAEAAARRAHGAVRQRARKDRSAAPGSAPPIAALRLAELAVELHQLREVVDAGAADYERLKDTAEVETLQFSARMDNVKLSASALATSILPKAMAICGLDGYRNHSEFSVARLARDAMAAPLMVNNDRSLQASAQALLVRKQL
jgi:acyl-CoA dehydrogenase